MTENERLEVMLCDTRLAALRAELSAISKRRRAILARVRMRKPKEPT